MKWWRGGERIGVGASWGGGDSCEERAWDLAGEFELYLNLNFDMLLVAARAGSNYRTCKVENFEPYEIGADEVFN